MPKVFGSREALILDPLRGIQAAYLTLEPGQVDRVRWKLSVGDGLTPTKLRAIAGFGRPVCESVKPDQLPI